RTGVRALRAIIDKHGAEEFAAAVEAVFDHGEAAVRRFIEPIPDGRYSACCQIDSNGISDEPIPFDVVIEIRGSDVIVDLTDAPPQQAGPINSPRAATISMARVALATLAGAGDTPNEGQFRPLTVLTREQTLFHPVAPAPSFAYWVGSLQLIEGCYR